MGSRQARDFADVRAAGDKDVFAEVKDFLKAKMAEGKRAVIAAYSKGSAERLSHLFKERGIYFGIKNTWAEVVKAPVGKPDIVVLALEHGFETKDIHMLTEQDILGERLARAPKKQNKNKDFIADVSSLVQGDLVVHSEHGIGKYEGLEIVSVDGAPHDCLLLTYAGGDKLYVPVENIEVLSKYGSEEAGVNLDSLGSSAWQMRKGRLKKRIRDMAEKLMKIAAARYLKKADVLPVPKDSYDAFVAGFPYVETDDQMRSIDDVIGDLASGRPMDRLVCGDVGFGKTEVALRASFVAAMDGKQVAIVAPTTILAKQHFELFKERFKNFPVKVGQLSRMVKAKEAALVKAELADGKMDIVIGTHALLAKTLRFKRLGLVVVDEEQHFGVKHKERLKELADNVHILTLTATPIPRTLQMSLAGVRELSVIATPPVDRLAVRTFVTPFDNVILREAILREHFRGGQVFYVCPRISDIAPVVDNLMRLVPEVKISYAHGQMSAADLEQKIIDFTSRKFDVLVATSIIESGIDMPTVNTIIIHNAHMSAIEYMKGQEAGLEANYNIADKSLNARLDVDFGGNMPSYKVTITGAVDNPVYAFDNKKAVEVAAVQQKLQNESASERAARKQAEDLQKAKEAEARRISFDNEFKDVKMAVAKAYKQANDAEKMGAVATGMGSIIASTKAVAEKMVAEFASLVDVSAKSEISDEDIALVGKVAEKLKEPIRQIEQNYGQVVMVAAKKLTKDYADSVAKFAKYAADMDKANPYLPAVSAAAKIVDDANYDAQMALRIVNETKIYKDAEDAVSRAKRAYDKSKTAVDSIVEATGYTEGL